MTRQADFKRRVRARMARTGESYAAARVHLLADRPGDGAAPQALHVTNGDSTVYGLRGTGLAHAIMPWRDVLHEGPVPAVPDDELRRIRAGFLAGANASDIGVVAEFAERDRTLEAHREGEYVLWFEADVYDQLQVTQILAKLRELAVPPDRITLICIGEHLGIAHFGGLGELSSEQLARLPEVAATTMTAAALEHATRAWDALRSPDPDGPEYDRRRSVRRAAVSGRGLRAAQPRISVHARRAVADRAAHPRRRQRRGADCRYRVRPHRRQGGAAVPRRHLVLRQDDGSSCELRRRCSRPSRRPRRSIGTPACASPTPAGWCSTGTRTTSRSTASTAGSAACT